MEDFSERLSRLFHESDYESVGELAKACDVTYDSMSKYLEGITRPSYKVLIRLQDAFKDLDYNWLLTGKG